MAFGIPNIERIVSNFLEGGTGITAIRAVEWDKNFLWTLDFVQGGNSIAPPKPFNAFFPASDITIGLANIQSDERDFGQTSFKFPKRTQALNVSITFYDDEKRTLQTWFQDWMNIDILNNGDFISGMDDSHAINGSLKTKGDDRSRVYPTREIRIVQLDAYRKSVIPYHYRVYPEGDFQFTGSQGSQGTQYTLDFVIVEDIAKKASSKQGEAGLFGVTFTDVKQLLGRFI